MKGTHYFGLHGSRIRHKKSVTLSQNVKCFFRPAISFPTGRDVCFRTAVPDSPVDLGVCVLQSRSGTVFFNVTVLIGQVAIAAFSSGAQGGPSPSLKRSIS